MGWGDAELPAGAPAGWDVLLYIGDVSKAADSGDGTGPAVAARGVGGVRAAVVVFARCDRVAAGSFARDLDAAGGRRGFLDAMGGGEAGVHGGVASRERGCDRRGGAVAAAAVGMAAAVLRAHPPRRTRSRTALRLPALQPGETRSGDVSARVGVVELSAVRGQAYLPAGLVVRLQRTTGERPGFFMGGRARDGVRHAGGSGTQ